jgi:palmitoyl-protein thioesterase
MANARSFLPIDGSGGSEEDYQQLSTATDEGQARWRFFRTLGVAATVCFAVVALVNGDGSRHHHRLHGATWTEPTSLAASTQSTSTQFRPIFFMHGIAEGYYSFDNVVSWLQEARPGSLLFPIKLYRGDKSYENPLIKQLNGLIAEIRGIIGVHPEAFDGGYDLVCHSQGAVLCRALCQVMDDHKVHTLISLAGPQMGVYGKTWFKEFDPAGALPQLPGFLPNVFESTAFHNFYTVSYTQQMQDSTSLANLWHDPLHEEAFLENNAFLPFVNGLIGEGVPAGMKANFARLNKAVFLVGSFSDQDFDSKIGLEPWCTGVFAFFAAGSGSGTPCVPMENQDFFIKDKFGLKSLHDAGRLHVQAVDGVRHGDWLKSEDVFSKYILPHLI